MPIEIGMASDTTVISLMMKVQNIQDLLSPVAGFTLEGYVVDLCVFWRCIRGSLSLGDGLLLVKFDIDIIYRFFLLQCQDQIGGDVVDSGHSKAYTPKHTLNDSIAEISVATKIMAPDILDFDTGLPETRKTLQFCAKYTFKRNSVDGHVTVSCQPKAKEILENRFLELLRGYVKRLQGKPLSANMTTSMLEMVMELPVPARYVAQNGTYVYEPELAKWTEEDKLVIQQIIKGMYPVLELKPRLRREAIFALAGRFQIELSAEDRSELEDAVKAEKSEFFFVGEEVKEEADPSSGSGGPMPKRHGKKPSFVKKEE